MSLLRSNMGDLVTYGLGYILSLILTGIAFAIVYFKILPSSSAFGVILGLGLVQIIVHMRCFLHLDLQKSARSDLMLVLFSTLIIALMVGGTLIILFNLRTRMM